MSKTMTRFLSLLLIAVLAISLCGCGGEGKKTESNQIKLEDYELLYKDACIMTDSDGNDAVVLTLDFTNNSKENASYLWSVNETAHAERRGAGGRVRRYRLRLPLLR